MDLVRVYAHTCVLVPYWLVAPVIVVSFPPAAYIEFWLNPARDPQQLLSSGTPEVF